ncbi:MAG: metal-dependent transcriptional regulator [Candidatus Omnitrophica bacterium]|nr:metal-dependent transcriptional regulator [Candidatus Omnitrophota bacterium]MCM8808963.1 metal-dependent transcriptional regulator [Candidatus Omnitrophota bacterium]MCM8811327.1 metal-dependent transcriptional regulator [Candidatus Omnitrophota bacterium]MCM8833655.1 metal-dependent transcriptional regulator [Candidatus Omnitrophota bacterium]
MLTKSLEDYLEAIKLLTINKKVTRVKEISKLLDVKNSSVVNALNILKEKGYIKQEKYGYIELTDIGNKEATKILNKHKIVLKFLVDVLNVSEDVAKNDACKIEHVISEETLKKMLISLGKKKI